MQKKKVALSWSGGKDSALSLWRMLNHNDYDVRYLFTTVNRNTERVSLHGIQERLLRYQAQMIGIPLVIIYVKTGSMSEYEQCLSAQLKAFKKEGINHIAYGDIYLEDLKQSRDALLRANGLQGLYPLWQQATRLLVNDFITHSFRALTCCVNDRYLDATYLGVELNRSFFSQLPTQVCPCGENGEYHSFVFDGPFFRKSLCVELGNVVYKPFMEKPQKTVLKTISLNGFWFIDILSSHVECAEVQCVVSANL